MDHTLQAIVEFAHAHRETGDGFAMACDMCSRLFPGQDLSPESVWARLTPEQRERARQPARRADLQRWQEALTSLGFGVVIADKAGNLLHWNDRAIDLLELERDSVHCPLRDLATFFELSVPGGPVLPWEQWPMARLLRGEPVRNLELQIRRTDRDRCWTMRYDGAVVPDPAGGGDLCVLALHDATEERRVQGELRQSLELLQAVTSGTTDAVFVKNRQGRYLLMNEAGCRIVGRSAVGLDDTDLFEPATARFLKERDAGIMAKGTVSTEEESLVVDGVVRTNLATKAPYRDAEGQVIGLVGISRDISERKAGEEALRESEARLRASENLFRSVIDHARAVIWVKDLQGRFNVINRYALEMHGRTEEEVLGHTVHELFDSAVADAVKASDQEAVRLGEPYEVEETVGGLTYLSVKFPLRSADGSIRALAAICTDITERKLLEAQVAQALKMEAVGRLAGGVAHDFNNMLTVINGYCDLLLASLSPGPDRTVVEAIRDAGSRSARLTGQLLAFSRKAIVAPRVLELNELLREAETLLRRVLGEDLVLDLELGQPLSAVKADRGQLEQLIVNLAVNARDAMPQGGRLSLRTAPCRLLAHAELPPGDYVELLVTDTGCGMPPEVLERAFEPFFTTKPPGQGTGLGLSVVHGAVRQVEGHVSVTSQPGQGTTFRILLPACAEAVTVAPEPQAPAEVGAPTTVLLVEDEEAVRKLVARILTGHGYRVLSAPGGTEALQQESEWEGPIDVLLVDVVMPGMTGPQVAAAVRARRPHVPVLFLSGYTDDAIVRRGALDASADVLVKPFGPGELLNRLGSLLATAG